MPPEVLSLAVGEQGFPITTAVDMWSFGIIMYVAFKGEFLVEMDKNIACRFKILMNDVMRFAMSNLVPKEHSRWSKQQRNWFKDYKNLRPKDIDLGCDRNIDNECNFTYKHLCRLVF
jgi:serine/threonine protein kinase